MHAALSPQETDVAGHPPQPPVLKEECSSSKKGWTKWYLKHKKESKGLTVPVGKTVILIKRDREH